MDTPGYDPMGTTGQIAGGANLVAFTTGRGSCFGAKPSPSVKRATNTRMFARMRDDMDINCGDIMDGGSTIESKGLEIYRKLIDVASGEACRRSASRPGIPRRSSRPKSTRATAPTPAVVRMMRVNLFRPVHVRTLTRQSRSYPGCGA